MTLKIPLLLALILSGCTVKVHKLEPFDPAKPLTGGPLSEGHFYTQGNSTIYPADMISYFEASPVTAKTMDHHGPLYWTSAALAFLGGAAIGWGLGEATDGDGRPSHALGAGIALLAGGVYVGKKADAKVDESVRLHNDTFKKIQAHTTWITVPIANF